MTFLVPGFLFALAALSIPVIIHLFNFRKYKIVPFTNVRFLKEVKKDTQSRNKLKQLLILISRLLLLACLILAFAQPVIPSSTGVVVEGQKTVSIYIDNSFSMDAIGKNGPLLEDARKKAREIASSFSSTDRFQLLTNDFEGRHQRLVNKEEFLELLEEVTLSSSVRTLSSVLSRQSDALKNAGTNSKSAYILSDFQRSTTDLDVVKSDSALPVRLVPLSPQTRGNIFIDSVWFSGPVRQKDLADKVYVRIRNLSGNVVENNPVKLFINGQQRSPSSYSIEPGSATDVFLSFIIKEPGIQQCRVEITDYPVTFDDVFYFSFEVKKQVPVLCLKENSTDSTNTTRAIFSDSLFSYDQVDSKNIDYAAFGRYSLIIMEGLKKIPSGLSAELQKFVRNGGSLIVFPSDQPELNSYKDLLSPLGVNHYESLDTSKAKVSRIFYEHALFADVFESRPNNIDLPVAARHFKFSKRVNTTEEMLLQFQNGDPFFSLLPVEKGKVYLSAVALTPTFSNFTQHALFVPVMFQAGLYSQPVRKLYYNLGEESPVQVDQLPPGSDKVLHISGENNFDIIPESRVLGSFTTVFVHDQVTKAGNYFLVTGDSVLSGLSFNFNRKESDLSCYEPSELSELITKHNLEGFTMIEPGQKSMAELISQSDIGTPLWKWFIIGALIFLATEVLLIRFMN